MKNRLLLCGFSALFIALLAAMGGAARPVLLTALISDRHWTTFFFGLGVSSKLLDGIPTIYAVLILELLEGMALVIQGVMLSHLAVSIGRGWRTTLTRSILHTMASDAGSLLTRYVALMKSYVEVVELFFRQYCVQSIAALVQLMVAISLVFTVNAAASMLLLCEIVCLLILTTIYAHIHVKLAQQRMAADEKLLSNTSLNPRKGFAIWFGGLGSLWFRERIREIKLLANARIGLATGEVSYTNAMTIVLGLFVVLGYAVIVSLGYGDKSDFLAFLLYSGFMMGPVLRVSSFVPEYREYLLASRGLADAVRNSPTRDRKLIPDVSLSFAATDARMPDRRAPINIEIRSGDRLALIGTSGSGKTTAIEALLGAKDGILSNAAVSGLASRSVRLELPSVGVRYLTETPVFENGTVLFNCQAELSECKTIIWSLALFRGMDELAIEGFLQRSILQSGEPMSLGERQRVQLIRAIAAKPRALFLDEALSGLEEDLEREIIQALIGNRSIEILVYIGHRRSIQDLFSKRLTY